MATENMRKALDDIQLIQIWRLFLKFGSIMAIENLKSSKLTT
jgi:hypothetical protein